MEDMACCSSENVSPVTDLSRNLTTLRTVPIDLSVGTPQMPSKVSKIETPDSAGSFRLKVLTPLSECSSESEAEPSPLQPSLRRRAMITQLNRSLQDSPLLISRNGRRPTKRLSQELKEESVSLNSPLRKSSSQGYGSSTSDGFAPDELYPEEENKNKENLEPSKFSSLLSATLKCHDTTAPKKGPSSARRNLSFANGDNDTPVKSKRSNDDERLSKRPRTASRNLVEVSANIMMPRYYSESNIDREAAEGVIDKAIIETTLPTSGAHKSCALPTITAQTMNDVLSGKYDNVLSSFVIIDCRWPYEYDGGHIKGALNLYTQDLIYRQFLEKTPEDAEVSRKSGKNVVIFHCEFSSERGPKMSQFLRAMDRAANVYPKLFYPEVYILQGGYKEFFNAFKEHCYPQEYLKMVDERFAKECRLYRSQSKVFEKKGLTRNQSSQGRF